MNPRTFSTCWGWLESKFNQDYDLVYLDPLICKLAGSSRLRAVFKGWQREAEPADLVRDMMTQLDIDPKKDTPSSFWQKDGVGYKVKADRRLQRDLSQAIDRHLSKLCDRHCDNERRFQQLKASLHDKADKSGSDSLVIVDAMFARRSAASKAMQRVVDIPPSGAEDDQGRSIEGILTYVPGPLAYIREPALGLMVNSQAFYKCVDTTLMKADWYPFVRVVGLYATSANGPQFVNVIAILLRQYPSFDEVLAPAPGNKPLESLMGVLAHVQGAVNKELVALKNPPTNPVKVYEKDEFFLYPVYFSQLCCQLNGIDHKALKSEASQVFVALEQYLQHLGNLKTCLASLQVESRITDQDTDLTRILPELPEWREPTGLLSY